MKNFFKKNPLLILFSGGIILTIGDIFAAWWVREISGYFYFVVIIFYLIGMMLLVKSYENKNISVASLILVLFNVIILFFVGIFIFGETVNIFKIIGILLCFVSLYLLEFGKKIRIF